MKLTDAEREIVDRELARRYGRGQIDQLIAATFKPVGSSWGRRLRPVRISGETQMHRSHELARERGQR